MTGLKEAKYKAVGYLGVRILYLKRGICIYAFGVGADYTRLRCGGGAYRCGHIEMAASDTCTECVRICTHRGADSVCVEIRMHRGAGIASLQAVQLLSPISQTRKMKAWGLRAGGHLSRSPFTLSLKKSGA